MACCFLPQNLVGGFSAYIRPLKKKKKKCILELTFFEGSGRKSKYGVVFFTMFYPV